MGWGPIVHLENCTFSNSQYLVVESTCIKIQNPKKFIFKSLLRKWTPDHLLSFEYVLWLNMDPCKSFSSLCICVGFLGRLKKKITQTEIGTEILLNLTTVQQSSSIFLSSSFCHSPWYRFRHSFQKISDRLPSRHFLQMPVSTTSWRTENSEVITPPTSSQEDVKAASTSFSSLLFCCKSFTTLPVLWILPYSTASQS